MVGRPEIEAQYATKSYRYLRLTIVVMVVAVAISVLYEESWTGRECWLKSFSAYYFTPVHSMFVGAMVAIGACLIAIKGTNEWEDMCFNVAGILAPIVAFVPTNNPLPADAATLEVCGSPILVGQAFDNSAFVSNNVTAMAIAGVAVVVLAYVVAYWEQVWSAVRHPDVAGTRAAARKVHWSTMLGLGLATVVVVGLFVWYHWFHRSFVENAHDRTAIAMFVAIGVAVVINAMRTNGWYRVLYWAAAAIMLVGVLGPLAMTWLDDGFEHEVIWIEAIELVGFGLFWTAQSVEHWNIKVLPDAARKPKQRKPFTQPTTDGDLADQPTAVIGPGARRLEYADDCDAPVSPPVGGVGGVS